MAILAAVTTLLILLVIFTSRNLAQTRRQLEYAFQQEAEILIKAIEAGSRTGMRMSWKIDSLQALVEELGKAPKVVYISVIGIDNQILIQTQKKEGMPAPSVMDPNMFSEDRSEIFTRVAASNNEGSDVFEITARISPQPQALSGQSSGSMRMRRGRMGSHHAQIARVAAIRLGLDMSELKQLQQREVKNALLVFIVLSIIGSAALYGIVFTQNYHAVNQTLRTMETYTQHVVDSMTNGLISLDPQEQVVTMNRRAHHILKLPPDASMTGKSLTDVMTIHAADILNALAQGTPLIDREISCQTDAQQTIPLSLSASTLIDDKGNTLGTVLLFRDLSHVKALEEQVKRTERLASLGKLAAGVAHEIRNPLGSLKGFLQYFQRKLELQEQDRTYLSVMIREVDRLNAVIANLLDYARPKEPELESCQMTDLIRHVLTLIQGDMQAKQLDVFLNPEDSLPQIQIDRDQITQVVLNIVLNAIQASQAGGHIRLELHKNQAKHSIELIVTDTGTGIAAADLPHIFDPFFTTKKQGGGLGLAIAHTIMENHHGDILAESKQNQGSTFRVRLPLSNDGIN